MIMGLYYTLRVILICCVDCRFLVILGLTMPLFLFFGLIVLGLFYTGMNIFYICTDVESV